VKHHLDHLRIVVAGGLDSVDIVFGDMAALAHDFDSEAHRGIRPGSFEAPLRLAVISASSSLARFLPR
jgi:hypothetical protein